MKDKIRQLELPLEDEDIEFRIGSSFKNSGGFTLLAYKTSRADVKRLNKVFGTLWQNEFYYDKKDNLCCIISLYDTDIQQWIKRVDTGTESMTEKEKGSYSDALKRAGFRCGIGNELYKYPFMWVKCDSWRKNSKGKDIPAFNVASWKKVGNTIIDEKGNVRYTFPSTFKVSHKEKKLLLKDSENWELVLKALSDGYSVSQIERKYLISDKLYNELHLKEQGYKEGKQVNKTIKTK